LIPVFGKERRSEKFLAVAQAFQPVRINEAGEDARPTGFYSGFQAGMGNQLM
jgi:hypothetical protein